MVKSALFITAGYCPVCHRIAREAIEPVIEAGYDVRIVDGMQEPAIARKYHIDRVPVLVLVETPEPDASDLDFWREVFETHRMVTGSGKPKTDAWIIRWLKDPHSDSAEYKLWGNGVALPCVCFVLAGIVYYARNAG